MQKVHIEFWQDVTSLLFAMRTSTVATALKKYLTMIISTHFLACVAWRFWLGALSNKGVQGQRNREEIGAEAT